MACLTVSSDDWEKANNATATLTVDDIVVHDDLFVVQHRPDRVAPAEDFTCAPAAALVVAEEPGRVLWLDLTSPEPLAQGDEIALPAPYVAIGGYDAPLSYHVGAGSHEGLFGGTATITSLTEDAFTLELRDSEACTIVDGELPVDCRAIALAVLEVVPTADSEPVDGTFCGYPHEPWAVVWGEDLCNTGPVVRSCATDTGTGR